MELGRFDADLEMFIDKPRESRMTHLLFLRDLAERGLFGPKPLSAPRGENVFRLSSADIRKFALVQGDQELRPQTAREKHMAEMGSD